jgi:hypothetical protein
MCSDNTAAAAAIAPVSSACDLLPAGAMGLPVSGFPNMNAVSLEDATGQNYIATVDFLKVGVLGSVMAYGIIISIGYVLMLAVGF